MKTSRQAAFEAVYRVLYEDAYSNIAIDKALEELQEGSAFSARLAYGVIERKLTLDFLISKYCTKPKPKVLVILYLGVYQLYFMDGVPSSAAVDECVKLAKANGLAYYSKLINAVLRKIDSNRIDIEEIDDPSIKYSVPVSLINMWKKQYGVEATKSILNALNGRPPVFAIPNLTVISADELLLKLKNDGVNCEPYDDVIRINSSADITKTAAFKDGLFFIQDYSCYCAIKSLNIKTDSVVLDVCAAPGGKSFTAAVLCKDNVRIYSYDIHSNRVSLINKGAERLHLSSVRASVNDAGNFNDKLPSADYVICDVPCSGFGIIRRKPEIRYKDLDSVKDLPELQFKILSVSASYLKKGGRLMYSTCTLNKKENEKVVERFLAENKEYSLVEEKTFTPDCNGGDGFYYSIIERQ